MVSSHAITLPSIPVNKDNVTHDPSLPQITPFVENVDVPHPDFDAVQTERFPQHDGIIIPQRDSRQPADRVRCGICEANQTKHVHAGLDNDWGAVAKADGKGCAQDTSTAVVLPKSDKPGLEVRRVKGIFALPEPILLPCESVSASSRIKIGRTNGAAMCHKATAAFPA